MTGAHSEADVQSPEDRYAETLLAQVGGNQLALNDQMGFFRGHHTITPTLEHLRHKPSGSRRYMTRSQTTNTKRAGLRQIPEDITQQEVKELMNGSGIMSVPPRNGWGTGDLATELRPGKSATRWLHDFLKGHVGDYVDENREPIGSLFVPCQKASLPHFLTLQGLDEGNGQHDLLIIESQSIEDQQLSCICRFCKYHFLFRFDKKCDLCPPKKLHHLVRLAVDRAVPQVEVPEESERHKYFPQTNSALWQCSEKQCGFKVMVYMTRPRLQVEQVELVADVGRIERQAAAAKQQDPERFKDLHENVTKTALVTLNAYLRDITKKPEDTQTIKIAARNKRFMVQFGESCSDFFNYLGFSKIEYEGERYWLLPILKHYPGDKTPIGSQRAFFEDVRSEVQALLDGSDLNAHTKEVVPVPALHRLWKALDSTPFPASGAMPEDNTAYVKLGILPNSDDNTVQQAYEAQIEADPARSADYLQALSEIAASRGSDLQFFAAQQQSLVDNQHGQVSNDAPLAVAYHHFGLDSNQAYPDDQIIQIYNVLCESSPAQNSEHRHNLAVIGRSKKSTPIMRAACASLSFEAACQVLGLDGVTKDATEPPDAALIETYADIVEKEGKECFLVAAALDTIADAFEPIRDQLRASANAYRRGERAADFPEMMGVEPVDLNVPLGIENLRNTCYLNSILQYFYTITPVRDLVLERTSGSTQQQVAEFPARMSVEQADIYIGQELIKSLGDLFTQLRSSKGKSVLPPQRLANAASISLERLRQTPGSNSGTAPSNATTPMDAPPLPARPGVTGPSTDVSSGRSTSVVTVSTVEDVSGTSTPASMASSQTLIDHPMEDPPNEEKQADADASASAAAAGLGEAQIDPSSEGFEKGSVAAEATVNAGASTSLKTDATTPIVEYVSKQDIDAILDQTEIHGTDQMDVEEIMGRCLGYIRAAINTNSIKDQTSSDIIFDTFYTHYVDVKKPKDQSRISRTQVVDRWFTAYPGVDGRVNLYDALAGTFDLEEVSATEGPLDRFTSIVKPAPIFHIFIQRSAIGIKNANPVQIPDELYLDRYMDAPEDSQLFRIRKRGWNLKRQIEEYQAVLAAGKSSSLEAAPGSLNSGGGDVELYEESNLGIDSADDGSFVVVDGDSESLIQLVDDDNEAVMVGGESLDEEMEGVAVGTGMSQPEVPLQTPGVEELKAELAGLFDGLTTHKYRLHAVICHAGQMAAGHYWVWIFDFDAQVWRKYNDAAVMERSTAKTHEVLEELSTRGEPYYLAYVREEGRDKLVQVPPRLVDEVAPPAPALVAEDDDLLLAYEG